MVSKKSEFISADEILASIDYSQDYSESGSNQILVGHQDESDLIEDESAA